MQYLFGEIYDHSVIECPFYISYFELLSGVNMARKKNMLNLSPHDEHKVLLLVTGLVFGMALSCFIFQIYTYAGLAAVAIGLVLLLIENREQKLNR